MKIQSIHTERELCQRIAEGDEGAFELFYNTHVVAVGRIVFRLVHAESQTRDIVQEIFLKLWLSRHRLIEVSDLPSYLYRIAYNCSFDHIRLEKLQNQMKADMISEPEPFANTQDGVAVVDFRETTRLITAAVNSLHPRSREIYQLNRIKGLKPQEIADELSLSVQSVRNSLTRSAKTIRDYLEQHGIALPLFLILASLPELTA